MPSEDVKILEFDQFQKSEKAPFIAYGDLECIIEKIDGCKNNPENSSTTKVSEHIPSDFSMSTILSFKSIENKHDVYGENFEKFENKYLKDKKCPKVRDIGEYRGAAHSMCNVKYSEPKKCL